MNSMSDMTSKERCDEVSEEDDQPAATVNQVHHKPPPDGGWGWVVCLGAWMVNFLTVGQQNAAGVVYSALLNEYSTKRGETGRVANTNLRHLTHRVHLKIGNSLNKIVTVYVKGRFRLNRVLFLAISLHNLLAISIHNSV